MQELEKLKQELKAINKEAAGIRDLPVEKRAEFGRKINERRQEVLEKIKNVERAMMDVEAEAIDVTAWSGINEEAPEFYPTEMGFDV